MHNTVASSSTALKETYNLINLYIFVFGIYYKVLFIEGTRQIFVNNAGNKDADLDIRFFSICHTFKIYTFDINPKLILITYFNIMALISAEV